MSVIGIRRIFNISVAILAQALIPGYLSAMSDVFRWAKDLRPLLAHARIPLLVLSPCAGVNGPVRALKALGMPWKSTGEFDYNIALYRLLVELSGVKQVRCGQTSGDLRLIGVEELDLRTKAVIKGHHVHHSQR